MIGKYKSDWIGILLILAAFFVLAGDLKAQSTTVTGAYFSEGSGGTFTIYVYYSDMSYESWNYNQAGQGSGSNGAYWAWYLSSGGSGYGTPDASIVCYADQNTSDYYYAQRIAWVLAHPGQTVPDSVGTSAFNTACGSSQALPFVPPDGVTGCRVEYGMDVPVGAYTDQSVVTYGCVNGAEAVIATKTCWVGPGGSLGCTDNKGNAIGLGTWTGLQTPGSVGTCSCSSSTTCTGSVGWLAVMVNDGSVEWQQTSNTCSSGCQAVCPGSAPTVDGVTTTTSCSTSATGTCPVKSPTCSGTCNYTAVAVDANDPTKGYTWAFSDSDCNSYVTNCNCPANPGGACPTGTGQSTSVSCGANDGGTCTGNGGGGTSSGSCDNSCVWKWVPDTETPPNKCGCSWFVNVQRGTPSSSSTLGTTYSWGLGGPTGSECDGCTCTVPPPIDPEFAYSTGNEFVTLACDGVASNNGQGRWEKQSGDCGKTCSCAEPDTKGATTGEEKTTACSSKPVACECSFSWTQVKTQLVDLLNSKFDLALPQVGGNTCFTITVPVLGGNTASIDFCSSYPNASVWWQTCMETMRLFIRYLGLAVIWWRFISYMIETLLSGW